ncbi:uncharacterized protein A4U43_C02F7590 [Asparagus officinalis]|uniref:Uncharacterized protein n=1 Tax=Asparagus officinalis TaxID=4686 RepID=A0A5P1FGQ3_ASPOF|nr:uncharacterized protein A4U43_C02F7590 [Asparagus officinalis]
MSEMLKCGVESKRRSSGRRKRVSEWAGGGRSGPRVWWRILLRDRGVKVKVGKHLQVDEYVYLASLFCRS